MLLGWPARRWIVALCASSLAVVALVVPTALIATPWFSREIPPTWWSWPVAVATATMSGLLLASYVAAGQPVPARREARSAGAGGILSFLAVGCPVCNKLVLAALGASGAMTWFAPVQPLLAVAALALVGWALWRRLRGEIVCRAPAG